MTHDTGRDLRSSYARPATPADRLFDPFLSFMRVEAASGILLLACTVLALCAANSSLAPAWQTFWQHPFAVGPEGFELRKPLILWVNDGLMAIFFFLVGLEIKREMLAGELATPAQALPPVLAAAGGMAAPALIYLAFNLGHPSGIAEGWAVPMATDIAFALGVLSLAGDRVPLSVKVFLTALAIADDIGAVLAIALFYTADISLAALGIGFAGLAVAALGNALGVVRTLFYVLAGAVTWVAFLKSGVHATVAGVLLAFCIPARARATPGDLVRAGRRLLVTVENGAADGHLLADGHRHAAVEAMETAARHAAAPLRRLEHALAPWVAWGIMPVFALANAGVAVSADLLGGLGNPVTLGVAAGLFLGKQLGVLAAVWLPVKLGLARLPRDMTWRHVYGIALLAGIGFTMALFVAQLAYADPRTLDYAKVGILSASLVAGVCGWLVLRALDKEAASPYTPSSPQRRPRSPVAQSAERVTVNH